MARGFPDFFGQNIFPVHGAFAEDNYVGVGLVSLVSVPIHTLTGKGIIRGGQGYMWSATADGDASWALTAVIDDSAGILLMNEAPAAREIINPESMYLKITYMDYQTSWISWVLKTEIPFIASAIFSLIPTFTTGAVSAISEIYYSLYT